MQQRPIPKRFLFQSVIAAVVIATATLLLSVLQSQLTTPIIALLYLLPVLILSTRWGLAAGIVASIGAFVCFNYFFIPPYYTLFVHQTQDVIVLLVFLTVSIVTSELIGRVQSSLAEAQAREREVIHLYELSATLAGVRQPEEIGRILLKKISEILQPSGVQIILKTSADQTSVSQASDGALPAGAPAYGIPLVTSRDQWGEIRLWQGDNTLNETEIRLLHAFAGQAALALERAALIETETRTTILEESDQFKSVLLSSVSHDLRTPLASITGALSSLDRDSAYLDDAARHELIGTAFEQAQRLNRLVGNLLDMTRLEATMLRPALEPVDVEELVGVALQEMETGLAQRQLVLNIPAGLAPVPIDLVLMSRVLVNILDNAVKYSSMGTTIKIDARQTDMMLEIVVSDEGIGIPASSLDHIFDKFYRVRRRNGVGGTGLGLSISRGFTEMHGGHIRAENRVEGGARITITLPLNANSRGQK